MAKQNQGKERGEDDEVEDGVAPTKYAASADNWMGDEDDDPMEDSALESDEEETL